LIKKFFILLIFFNILQAQAFEDYIVTTKGKLTNIEIENNTIIDVHPLVTLMNDKNTLIVHPLKTGATCFKVRKNYKENFLFQVFVEENKTTISNVDGFEVLSIDVPPEEDFILDLPPLLKNTPVLRNKEEI